MSAHREHIQAVMIGVGDDPDDASTVCTHRQVVDAVLEHDHERFEQRRSLGNRHDRPGHERRDRRRCVAAPGDDSAAKVAVLGALFGRRKASMTSLGRAASAARGVGRTVRQHGDVAAAEEGVEVVRARIAELEEETRQRIDDLTARLAVDRETLVEVPIRPKKADISVTFVVLGWRPVRPDR